MDVIQLSSLDHYFADFITRIEGEPCEGLWIAAALVSAVSSRGSACIDLSKTVACEVVLYQAETGPVQIPPVGQWLELLAGCSTVGKPGDFTPLVLDATGRLYLHRFWEYERLVANGVLERCVPLSVDSNGLEAALDRYFSPIIDGQDQQREAARAALSRCFVVISGGPGTGKTSTVARILALLVEQADAAPPVIMLAAPTGKAAMRLKQSVSQAVAQLPLADLVRAAMPLEVSTLHRMLGVIPGQSGFRHNCDNRLLCDVLVIDEASMIDLPLMSRLLAALRVDTRVILLGDRDQLASVEAGAVMADICAGCGNDSKSAAAHPAVIELIKSYRFTEQSGIGRLSRLINAGDGTGALSLLKSGAYSDISWSPIPAEGVFVESFKMAAREGFASYAHSISPVVALEELDRFRILAPHREGRHGVLALNRMVEAALLSSKRENPSLAPLLPVMVTGNNYDLGLYNGDTGVVMEMKAEEEPSVFFPSFDAELRRLSLLRLPAHETAFALTVHKTQGSEFDRVLLILPDQFSDILSRELLYTAITRARTRLEIWGNEDIFCSAVERRVVRITGLADKIWNEVP